MTSVFIQGATGRAAVALCEQTIFPPSAAWPKEIRIYGFFGTGEKGPPVSAARPLFRIWSAGPWGCREWPRLAAAYPFDLPKMPIRQR